ncbi:hypothetical protein SLS57_001978 [Botryosphaeria dothidea]
MLSPTSINLLALASYATLASAAWPPAPDAFIAGATTQNCPFSGQIFPSPSSPGSSSAINAAHSSLKSQLDAALQPGARNPLGIQLNGDFLSIGVFSTADGNGSSDGTLFDYHYAVPGQANATAGAKTDRNTIFRIGSISKLLTVYTLLVERGDLDWNQPITKFIPGLTDSDNDDDEDFSRIRWDDITIGALASHLSGIARDYAWPDFVTNFTQVPALETLVGVNTSGITPDDISPCALPLVNPTSLPLCTQFIAGLETLGPYFPAFESPTYSNAGFRLLGTVIENMTGEAFDDVFQRNLLDPLKLSSTSVKAPKDETHAVIPGGNKLLAQWGINLGEENPAGGMYSSVADLSAIGRSILRSSLLSPALTRRWLKPHSRTSDDGVAIGAPWEISSFRIPLTANVSAVDGDIPTTRADIYTKTGSLGLYNSMVGLDPDRNWGFVVLGAGPSSSVSAAYVSDLIARTYTPAFEAAAREEAAAAFAGTYVAKEASNDSTLTLALQPERPGIGVAKWMSNGVDVLKVLSSSFSSSSNTTEKAAPTGNIRMYPARLRSKTKVAFRALFEPLPSSTLGGPMESACRTWFSADVAQIADKMIDDVVVGVDEKTGRAQWVEVRAWRMRYERVG